MNRTGIFLATAATLALAALVVGLPRLNAAATQVASGVILTFTVPGGAKLERVLGYSDVRMYKKSVNAKARRDYGLMGSTY